MIYYDDLPEEPFGIEPEFPRHVNCRCNDLDPQEVDDLLDIVEQGPLEAVPIVDVSELEGRRWKHESI